MDAGLGKQYADLMFLNEPYNLSMGEELRVISATEAEHQLKSHTQPQPGRKEAAPLAPSWTFSPKETVSSLKTDRASHPSRSPSAFFHCYSAHGSTKINTHIFIFYLIFSHVSDV